MPTRRQPVQESTPQAPQSTPGPIGAGHGGSDYTAFVWQQLNDIQGKLGALQHAMDSQAAALEKLDAKASSLGDRVHSINIRLSVAAAIVALVVTVGGWVLKEVWDVAKPLLVQRLAPPAK